jgi:Flp pilus assembly protein TadD
MKPLDVTRTAFAVIALVVGPHVAAGQAQEGPEQANSSAANEANALAEPRKMIDRGRSEDALKILDGLAARQPPPAGVDTLRGVAFYAQSRFADADAAFAIALNKNARDEEAIRKTGRGNSFS